MIRYTESQIREFCTIKEVRSFSSQRTNLEGIPKPDIVMLFKSLLVINFEFTGGMCMCIAPKSGKPLKLRMSGSQWSEVRVFREIVYN